MSSQNFVARPGSQFVQSGTGAVERTVSSKLQDVVSVLDFIPENEHAAIKAGTSTYNSAEAIQKAIDTGKTVFIPDGTYLCTSTINIAKRDIYGQSMSQTVLQFDVPSVAFKLDGDQSNYNTVLENFKIQDVGTSTIGIQLSGVRQFSLSKLFIVGFSTSGVYLTSDGTSEDAPITISFRNCAIVGNGDGILNDVFMTNNISFIENVIGANVSYGVRASSGGARKNWSFINNLLEANVSGFAEIDGIQGLNIQGNYWEAVSTERFLWLTSNTATRNQGICIKGNHFSGSGSECIKINIGDGVDIGGNYVNGTFTNFIAANTAGVITRYKFYCNAPDILNPYVTHFRDGLPSGQANNAYTISDGDLEGTWTPAARFTNPGTLAQTIQAGRFSKKGNVVTVSGLVVFNKGTATGDLDIFELPYTVATGLANYRAGVAITVDGIGAAGYVIQAFVVTGEKRIVLYKVPQTTGGGAAVSNTEVSSTASVAFEVTYIAG